MKWMELTAEDFEEARREAEGVAMLPIGSLERHGPHLPVGCDTFAIQRVADLVEAVEPVVVLPALPYTHVAVCVFHPGAIHIRQNALIEFVTCICDEVYRNGFEKIVLLHGHGGNIPLNSSILAHTLEARKPYALYSINIGSEEETRVRREIMESKTFGHAGEGETSCMLHIAPGLVKAERIRGRVFEPSPALDVAPAQTPVDWIARWPEMAVGEPELGTAEKGRRLIEAHVEAAVRAIRKIKKDTVVLEHLRRRGAMRL
ncbi:MAG: creatininase family protein [Candidatus Sumerlaeota bacterium]|nr:creatininase family protein [Candidatus Sumerlaeota bacterium]